MTSEEFKLMCERLPPPSVVFNSNPQFGFELKFDNGEKVVIKPQVNDADECVLTYDLQLQ